MTYEAVCVVWDEVGMESDTYEIEVTEKTPEAISKALAILINPVEPEVMTEGWPIKAVLNTSDGFIIEHRSDRNHLAVTIVQFV